MSIFRNALIAAYDGHINFDASRDKFDGYLLPNLVLSHSGLNFPEDLFKDVALLLAQPARASQVQIRQWPLQLDDLLIHILSAREQRVRAYLFSSQCFRKN